MHNQTLKSIPRFLRNINFWLHLIFILKPLCTTLKIKICKTKSFLSWNYFRRTFWLLHTSLHYLCSDQWTQRRDKNSVCGSYGKTISAVLGKLIIWAVYRHVIACHRKSKVVRTPRCIILCSVKIVYILLGSILLDIPLTHFTFFFSPWIRFL